MTDDATTPATEARWYCVNRDGLATLCLNEQDAHEMAAECDIDFPRGGPHRAVLMGDVAALRARVRELEAAHEDAIGAVLAERERCAGIVRHASSHGLCCSDCDALADLVAGIGA